MHWLYISYFRYFSVEIKKYVHQVQVAIYNSFCVSPVCYQWERYGIAPANLMKTFHYYCGSVKPNFQSGLGNWLLSCQFWLFAKFTDNFGIIFSKVHLKAAIILSHWDFVEKMVRLICLKPVSMETWNLHRLCISLYQCIH